MATHPHHKQNIDAHLQRTIVHALTMWLWHGALPLPVIAGTRRCIAPLFSFLRSHRTATLATHSQTWIPTPIDLESLRCSPPPPRRYNQAAMSPTPWSPRHSRRLARIPRLVVRVPSFAPSHFRSFRFFATDLGPITLTSFPISASLYFPPACSSPMVPPSTQLHCSVVSL